MEGPFSPLFGVEAEYAVTVFDRRRGKPRDADASALSLLQAAANRFPTLPAHDGHGFYLANGGRFYIDVGAHPEYGTPECTCPTDVVRYTRAGDRMMRLLASDLERDGALQALVFRGNTGYGNRATWGAHESFLCHRSPAMYVDGIVPFLATRMIYCGSGGFNPFDPGIAFTLSPRSYFITDIANRSTMDSRPLVNLRDEPLASSSYHRLHLICSDGLGSETAMWLRAGCTAIVIRMIDAGLLPAQGVTLCDPIGALRTFAADPSLSATVPIKDGSQVTAIDIQRRYLEMASSYFTQLAADTYPIWVPTVLQAWERMLRLLQEDPGGLNTVLDWRIKQMIYADFCRGKGVSWESLPFWNFVIERLATARRKAQPPVKSQLVELAQEVLRVGGESTASQPGKCNLIELIKAPGPVKDEAGRLSEYLGDHGLDWEDLPGVLSLRPQLFELDTRFLQLGDGIFEGLEAQGALRHQVVSDPHSIDLAMTTPPAGGRAALRGQFVKKYSGREGYSAAWTSLMDSTLHQTASLADPFAESAIWSSVRTDSRRHISGTELRTEALNSYINGRYDDARCLLEELLHAEYEVPSTLCHLARLALVTDDIEEATELTECAWRARDEAPHYIVLRIIWMKIALAMLQPAEQRVRELLDAFRCGLRPNSSESWSIEPVLAHLRGALSSDDHGLLSALAAAISDQRYVPALEAFPQWRESQMASRSPD